MSADDLDRFMRRARPPAEVSDERAARVVAGVMARLEAGPSARPTAWAALGGWLAGLASLPRFAVPMAAAAVLGVVVGQSLRPADHAAVIEQLFATSTSFYVGTGY